MLPDLSWAHSIDNILIYVDNYLKVLNIFRSKYKENIIDIDLENFTQNSEELGKKFLNFVN